MKLLPRLADDWHRVLLRAWSVRLIALAFVLSAASGLLYALPSLPVPTWLHVVASVLAPIADLAAFLARPIKQKNLGG